MSPFNHKKYIKKKDHKNKAYQQDFTITFSKLSSKLARMKASMTHFPGSNDSKFNS